MLYKLKQEFANGYWAARIYKRNYQHFDVYKFDKNVAKSVFLYLNNYYIDSEGKFLKCYHKNTIMWIHEEFLECCIK